MRDGILWTWPELCKAVGADAVNGPAVRGIDIDSRKLAPGELFVALNGDPGPRFPGARPSPRDGHDFLEAAFAAGAAGALVHRDAPGEGPRLVVGDTLDGLWDLGRAARARSMARVAAITGSSGKTTVKTFLAQALGAFATGGSLNNHLGVPLSLARTPADARFAVYEIGTNHPGEIAPLSRLARPDVAVVLNVHPAHIEFFEGIDALRREKLSIAEGLNPRGTLVCLDALDRTGLDAGLRVMTFGEGAGADARLAAFDGRQATIATPSGTVRAKVPGGGTHRALSLTAVAAVLVAFDEDPRRLADVADDAVPAGRGNRIEAGEVTLIDDSYNANPASMSAALRDLAGQRGAGRRVALLGEMLELGEDSERLHVALAPLCARIDRVFCVGDGMRALHDRLEPERRFGFVESPDDLDPVALTALLEPGDVVLLKGSNRVFWARDFAARLRDALNARAV
ncbi:MAG: UDP-N-acetylmuramoyl-tripeptide--D-alanyl-D-alanine ligase [Gammaproteobacteria bacterium]|nr:UDP-N-acetylmuramoyl-tripeptide--D-alanyl-D-alanine ligase [Gammaproteobacteria bacterium]